MRKAVRRKPGRTRRARALLRIAILSTGVLFLLLAGTLFAVWLYMVRMPELSPQDLYARAMRLVGANLYDPSASARLPSGKPGTTATSTQDAVQQVRQALALLQDRFTRVVTPQEVKSSIENATRKQATLGIYLSNRRSTGPFGEPCWLIDWTRAASPAFDAGITSGDCLVSIDGRLVGLIGKERVSERLESTSTKGARKLHIATGSSARDVVLESVPMAQSVVSARLLRDGTGYIRVEGFTSLSVSSQIAAALHTLQKACALVVDLRGNPGGFVHEAVRAASAFMDAGAVSTLSVRLPNGRYINVSLVVSAAAIGVRFLDAPFKPVVRLPARHKNLAGNRPVAVLVNDRTASAAELFAAVLQDNGIAVVVGNKTMGKGIGQTWFALGNGYALSITNFRWLTPGGVWLGDGGQTVPGGIEPDVVPAPAKQSDPYLAAAIKELSKMRSERSQGCTDKTIHY